MNWHSIIKDWGTELPHASVSQQWLHDQIKGILAEHGSELVFRDPQGNLSLYSASHPTDPMSELAAYFFTAQDANLNYRTVCRYAVNKKK